MGRIVDSAPYAQAVRGALARLAYNSPIGSAPKLNAFLIFVVEKTLAGDTKSLKAYTIAVGALGRNKDFNPATDAIVRVEAGRLRQALAHYYANEGATDPVIINIPRGCYVPTFAWNNFREERQSAAIDLGSILLAERRNALAEEYRHSRDDLHRSIEESRCLRRTMGALLEEHRQRHIKVTELIAETRMIVGAATTARAQSPSAAASEVVPVPWLGSDNEKFMSRYGLALTPPQRSVVSGQALPEADNSAQPEATRTH